MSQDSLHGLRVPVPPAELRERVLRAAHAARPKNVSSSSPWWATWLWVRPELPWMAAALLLLACHTLLFPRAGTAPGAVSISALRAERQQVAELRQVGVVLQTREYAVVDGQREQQRLLREAGLDRL